MGELHNFCNPLLCLSLLGDLKMWSCVCHLFLYTIEGYKSKSNFLLFITVDLMCFGIIDSKFYELYALPVWRFIMCCKNYLWNILKRRKKGNWNFSWHNVQNTYDSELRTRSLHFIYDVKYLNRATSRGGSYIRTRSLWWNIYEFKILPVWNLICTIILIGIHAC